MSMRADYVLAKGTLADYCRTRGQRHASFAGFNDVTARLSAWLARTESESRAAPPLVLSLWRVNLGETGGSDQNEMRRPIAK
jgi:hypothetical protein